MIAIYGPTSSGKTALSIQLALMLAERTGREPVVVSADSRQVYQYMDIGTSKTTTEDMRGIRHEMIDVAEPDRKMSLENYVRSAREVMENHLSRGRLPIIVGGTGIYVQSLLRGWDLTGTASTRQSFERDFPPSMCADAHATLKRLDKKAAAAISPRNYDAILNALTRAATANSADKPAPRPLVLAVDRSPKKLERRVTATLDRQLQLGLVDEVCHLADRYRLDDEFHERGNSSDNQVLHTHGYREFFEIASAANKQVSSLTAREVETARAMILDRIVPHTHRQRSWFPKLPNVRHVRQLGTAFQVVTAHLRL